MDVTISTPPIVLRGNSAVAVFLEYSCTPPGSAEIVSVYTEVIYQSGGFFCETLGYRHERFLPYRNSYCRSPSISLASVLIK